jgi:hypothetical protein
VYLARLYDDLFRDVRGQLHMATEFGQDHLALQEHIDSMTRRTWPASTERNTPFRINVTYQKEKFLMVVLDYPGEVFVNAFMKGIDGPAERELRDNVRRAAAIIVLVDPGVALEGGVMDNADQDYGLPAAIRASREWPGGEAIPVAVTLTKWDRFKVAIEEHGSAEAFLAKKYPNLHAAACGNNAWARVFGCAAAHTKVDGLGHEVPDLSRPGHGLREPLQYCLEEIRKERERQRARREQERTVRNAAQAERLIAEEERRANILTFLLLGGAVVTVAVAFVIFWNLLR